MASSMALDLWYSCAFDGLHGRFWVSATENQRLFVEKLAIVSCKILNFIFTFKGRFRLKLQAFKIKNTFDLKKTKKL